MSGRYFDADQEIPEAQAASRWFRYAGENDIDISRAISLWEDAATPEGESSREAIAGCGVRVVLPKN
ncbi:hypothetical protein B0G62_11168 [Paraburkholderia eburnea]|uniref:Uncharacterized protein n=1 Tax=Paraburkholderia eburnea TaxID=1189126 RepID=A0A2S4M3W6_9BURK|nr:hypothetical protein [Paraburkholderia eburnea]POR49401.1 hypothetical protein B0G62_11168 [Paraburkholderia eburnea]PRZ19969.1 hypothetical protein BX588_113109 [Paraburkholderia eburnea]